MRVDYVDHMGDDRTVVNAARVSFDKFHEVFTEGDAKLIKYLAKHGHISPFFHPQISLRITVPFFVANQLKRHQVGFAISEVSRRYVDTEPEFYIPNEWNIRPEGNIKQGSGTSTLPQPEFIYGFCIKCGKQILNLKGGMPKKYCSDNCKYKFTNEHRNPYKTIFLGAKGRAIKEGIEWSLNFDTFVFPEYCPYLGIKIDYSLCKGKIQEDSPSFDRKNPKLGYTEDNVELVSNKANIMKSNASPEEQIKMAEAVLLRYKAYVPDYNRSYEGLCKRAIELYNKMIESGYAPELARMVLPLSTYTSFIWTGSLYAFARVYNLRSKPDAQRQTREVAQLISDIISPLFPHSWSALCQKSE